MIWYLCCVGNVILSEMELTSDGGCLCFCLDEMKAPFCFFLKSFHLISSSLFLVIIYVWVVCYVIDEFVSCELCHVLSATRLTWFPLFLPFSILEFKLILLLSRPHCIICTSLDCILDFFFNMVMYAKCDRKDSTF